MPELNISLPPIDVYVRSERIFPDLASAAKTRALLISAASVPGQALYFQVLLQNGVLYERLTCNELFPATNVPFKIQAGTTGVLDRDITDAQAWDCPSPFVTFNQFDTLRDTSVLFRDGTDGRYVGTFDWYGSAISDQVGDFGHKSLHFIAKPQGFVLQPNDAVLFVSPAWTYDVLDFNLPYIRRNRVRSVPEYGTIHHTE